MAKFEFNMALSAQEVVSIYDGQKRFIVVESDQGLRLQLPAVNFRSFVTAQGIRGRFCVTVDANNKLQELRKL